jgi:hypothetical protein
VAFYIRHKRKEKSIMKKVFTGFIAYPAMSLVFTLPAFSPALIAGTWTAKGFEQKVFIENKGQFDLEMAGGTPVLYGAEEGAAKIFFTRDGLKYTLIKEPEMNRLSEEGNHKSTASGIAVSEVGMTWVGSNANARLISEDMVTEYYNYGLPEGGFVERARGFKKLVYKDLYPNVDAEYIFHPAHGIKYALILHPGADLSSIRMRYSGAHLSADADGNLHITTPAGEIIDHAPKTFYADTREEITSSFILSGETVSFDVAPFGLRPVIIDPWTTMPAFAMNNRVFDTGTDKFGNVYIYGSDMNFKLRKYSAAGVPEWTYVTTWNGWFGDLAVDSSGNSYITRGSDYHNQKISPTGTQVYYTVNVVLNLELFSICLNKTAPNLGPISLMAACFGARVSFINTITGTVGPPIAPAGLFPQGVELRSMCSSTNGLFYGLTITQIESFYGCSPNVTQYASVLIAFDSNFLNKWTVPSGYTGKSFGYHGVCYKPDQTGGQNSLAASYCFVYSYDGETLRKRDASTGALVKAIMVPGGSRGDNSGVYVDECDNVYVGTLTEVRQYDNNLAFVASAPVPGAVYDVKYNYAQNEVVACGNGFVTALDMAQPCTPVACNNNAVPVKLLSFGAEIVKKGVVLSWETASEDGCTRYEIERGTDLTGFGKLEEVSCTGSSNELKQYSVLDPSPLDGVSYYRLTAIGTDGEIGLQRTISISNLRKGILTLSPNPVSAGSAITLEYLAEQAGEAEACVYNFLGQPIYSSVSRCVSGKNTLSLSTSGLGKGWYIVEIKTNGGMERKPFTVH